MCGTLCKRRFVRRHRGYRVTTWYMLHLHVGRNFRVELAVWKAATAAICRRLCRVRRVQMCRGNGRCGWQLPTVPSRKLHGLGRTIGMHHVRAWARERPTNERPTNDLRHLPHWAIQSWDGRHWHRRFGPVHHLVRLFTAIAFHRKPIVFSKLIGFSGCCLAARPVACKTRKDRTRVIRVWGHKLRRMHVQLALTCQWRRRPVRCARSGELTTTRIPALPAKNALLGLIQWRGCCHAQAAVAFLV